MPDPDYRRPEPRGRFEIEDCDEKWLMLFLIAVGIVVATIIGIVGGLIHG